MPLPFDLIAADYRIRSRLVNRRLVCEAGLDRVELEDLLDAMPLEPDDAWHFCNVAAAVTVGIGVHSYKSGDYWDAFPRLNKSHRLRWGEHFLRFISQHPTLETFDFLREEHALRFVAPILGHGGVPCSCLDDLFELLLSYCDPEQSGAEALDALSVSAPKMAYAPQPVRRFISYGGEVAEDLVSRLLALWDARANNRDAGLGFGLPPHILEAFDAWFPARTSGTAQPHRRFPSPAIHFDPATRAVTLRLPPCSGLPGAGRIWHAADAEWPADRETVIAIGIPPPPTLHCGDRRLRTPIPRERGQLVS